LFDLIPSGKMNRGMTVLATWRLLLGDRQATEEEYFSAIVLAYCVELVCLPFVNKSIY
jgi:geranylgeranyl pyrophosphate synthase